MGNVTAADGNAFTYDSQNELVTMNGGAVQLKYDGDGNRVAKAATSSGVTTTTYYLVDDLNPTGLPQVMDELTNGLDQLVRVCGPVLLLSSVGTALMPYGEGNNLQG